MSEERKNAHYQIVRGFPCPLSDSFTRKKMEDAMDLEPGDGDLVLASYPRTGTTWVQYILLQIKSRGTLFPTLNDAASKYVPFIEKIGVAAVHAQDKPRFYKHHIAYNFVRKNCRSKCIYIYRNPEDTAASFYHFLKSVDPKFAPEFSDFFEGFVTGNIAYGSYFQHVLSFYEHSDDENLLMVSYENLQANRRDEILKMAKFLGEEHHRSLLDDEELLDRIMEHTSFEYMKKNVSFTHSASAGGLQEDRTEDTPKLEFFRKGVVGDGKCLLTDAQRQRLKATAEKILAGTSVIKEWYSE